MKREEKEMLIKEAKVKKDAVFVNEKKVRNILLI